ncbi:MAG: type II toxin-antitoxin system PemK/MazF family toxin [Deltaproteobacteria bacterium]|nr:type II toxin-antitoxin system PemK/MazF family toxin [Deltaproteobacteria bacterium]
MVEASPPSYPRQWHLYVVALDPRVGTKPGKQRPCLTIQPNEVAEAGLKSTMVIPLTTKLAKEDAFPLRIRLPKGTCGLNHESELMIDQMLAWDNSLFKEDLGEIAQELREKVKEAIKDFLNLL